jgi:hypothetical protein
MYTLASKAVLSSIVSFFLLPETISKDDEATVYDVVLYRICNNLIWKPYSASSKFQLCLWCLKCNFHWILISEPRQ